MRKHQKTDKYKKSTTKQIEVLTEILSKSELLNEAFTKAEKLKLPNWYFGAGCITQTVWNYLSNKDLSHGIKDFDLVYFDSSDTSYEAEDKYIQKLKKLFKNFPFEVEIKNQARVHLWYEKKFGSKIKPYRSVESGINTWPTTATAIGVRTENGKYIVYAPFGLDDLFSMTVKPNKVMVKKEIYQEKTKRWLSHWSNLKVLPW